uniref:Uncharacterized protein n=1 Tax=Ciona intestinalis TaxID=7719 RepID=H2XUL6_CIOIN
MKGLSTYPRSHRFFSKIAYFNISCFINFI